MTWQKLKKSQRVASAQAVLSSDNLKGQWPFFFGVIFLYNRFHEYAESYKLFV